MSTGALVAGTTAAGRPHRTLGAVRPRGRPVPGIGATVQRVTTQLWLLTAAQEAVPPAEVPVVDGDQWVAFDTMHLEMTHRFTMALATHPRRGRDRLTTSPG